MKMKIKVQPIHSFFMNNYLLIINIVCLLNLALRFENVGTISAIVILMTIALNKTCFHVIKKDFLFAIYLFICITSGIAYIYNGRPLSIFFAGISYNMIPSMIYLIGAVGAKTKKIEDVSYDFLKICLFIIAFGLLFYLFRSDFYFKYIDTGLENYKFGVSDYRFGSYITSSNMGSMCVSCISLIFIAANKFKNRIYMYLSLTIVGIALILCMQRSSWVVSIFAIVCIIFLSKMKTNKKIIYIMGICLISIAVYIFRDLIFSEAQRMYFLTRFSKLDFGEMVGERVNQYSNALEIIIHNPLGYGLGSLGHKAAAAGYGVVCDNNYLRILGEIGFIGFMSFVLLFVRAIKNAFQKKNSVVVILLICFALQAIGTNVFDLFLSSYIFWFFLGYATYNDSCILKSN